MGETAVKAAQACGYENAGTVEFLLDENGKFYFLEMNTRLQVEHPVTELCTGLDLVAEQLHIAEGRPLRMRQRDVVFRGHAIECRICAEDPAADFLPSTGTILHLRPPDGPGIREDRGFEEGATVPVFYDSLLSKLLVWGPDRLTAIHRMVRALREYELLGVRTNIPLCRFVLEHPLFAAGEISTAFLAEQKWAEEASARGEVDLAAAAAVAALLRHAHTAPLPGTAKGRTRGGGWQGWTAKRREAMY
jgi:propionyl-CoA carboxylase alpha chain